MGMKLKMMLITAMLLGACGSTQNNNNKPSEQPLRLYAFDCGRVSLSDMAFLYPGVQPGVSKEMSDECYLIEHPKGRLIWDTGLADGIGAEGIDVLDGAFHLRVQKPLFSQLEEIGLAPSDIDYIAMSHLHDDHTGNANAFADSKLIIQLPEHEAAFSDSAAQFGFTPSFYDKFAAEEATVIDGDYDVFGDGRVVIKAAPGHSPGHQALFVDLAQHGPVLLAGDLYHFQLSREEMLVPAFNFNEKQTRSSMQEIESFLHDNTAELWIPHDMAQFNARKHSPAYYE